MKKFLSLVLALVMTMSLVTVAGAADFDDAADIDYAEAVDVLEAVGIIAGYGDGTFRPEVQLNRGQAAKIICNLLLGPTTAEALPTDVAPFKDVAAGSTFAGYIAYCAKEGIINGYTDGTFRPTAPLTGYAFMKMLLGTLGYDAEVEGYVGNNWAVSVAKQALAIDLDAGLEGAFVGTKVVTRDEAALFAFNTLKAEEVEYDNNSTITIGDIVISSNTKATPVDNDPYYLDLFDGELDLDPSANVDAYGRPAHTWEYDDETIGTYADEADYVATSNVKVYEVRKALGLKTNEAVKFGGVDLPTADSKSTAKIAGTWAAAGNGVTVEFFYDEDDTYADTTDDYNTVVVIDEKIGEISKVKTTDDGTFAYIGSKSFETDEFAKEDIVLYTLNTDGDIETMKAAEKLTGTCSKVTDSKYTIDGVVYELHKGYSANDLAVGVEVEFYLDSCGYIIKDDKTKDSADLDNLIYVLDVANSAFDKIAKVVFGNGEKATITVKADDFSVADKDAGIIAVKEKSDKYEKTAPAGFSAVSAGTSYTNGDVSVGGVKVDAGTQFVYIDADDNVKTYVGFKNAPTVTGASIFAYYKSAPSAKAADLVVVNAGSVETKADALTYVIYDDYKMVTEKIGDDTVNYYVLTTIEGDDLVVDADSVNFATMWAALQAKSGEGVLALKSVTTDADDYVTNWVVESDTTKVLPATDVAGIAVAEDEGVVTVGSTNYSYDDEVVVYVVEDAEYTEIDIAGIDAKYTGVTTILDDGVVTGLILVKEVEEA